MDQQQTHKRKGRNGKKNSKTQKISQEIGKMSDAVNMIMTSLMNSNTEIYLPYEVTWDLRSCLSNPEYVIFLQNRPPKFLIINRNIET